MFLYINRSVAANEATGKKYEERYRRWASRKSLDSCRGECFGTSGGFCYPHDDERVCSVAQNPVEHVATFDIPVIELPNESDMDDTMGYTNTVFGSTSTPSTRMSRSSKRKSWENEEELKMMKEMHNKQMCTLDIQEKKAKLELYLLEKEILNKGYELPDWYNPSLNL
ncbi:hypothetical protein C0J52_22148 [Blattella germanica]|nr:hypothetical protein C0J52_22148 [Blattella germanica]